MFKVFTSVVNGGQLDAPEMEKNAGKQYFARLDSTFLAVYLKFLWICGYADGRRGPLIEMRGRVLIKRLNYYRF